MAEVEKLVHELTLEEKASLTAGGDIFATAAVERLGIPRVNVTDGPSGARGQSFPGMGGVPSSCIPCGSAIGATWDPDLAQELGELVGREARDRGCLGLLAPTVNLHRSPLAGRNFECYSEDPLLSGRLAVGYVQGVQSQAVFATVKHFVANEAEFERQTINSVVDERSLRELYLLPFELAVKEGGALGIMTSYNRLNGSWLTEQRSMLVDLLRDEWGFDGLVMTDWFAVASTEVSLGAGLDLEMPGPGRELGANVIGRVDEADLDAAVTRYLSALDRLGILDEPTPPDEPRPQSAADRALLRRAAADATVLLRNDGVLPLAGGRVAVIGAPAQEPRVNGGGSAGVVLHPLTSPLDALREVLDDVRFARGVEIGRSAAVVGGPVLRAPDGFEAVTTGAVEATEHLDELRKLVIGLGQETGDWSMRVTGTVVPEESGTFELALAQSGRARVHLDGDLVLDGVEHPPPPGGSDFFGMASQDLTARVELTAGQPVEVVVEYEKAGALLAGFRVGFRTVDADALLAQAVATAADADVAVVFVGTDAEWETEGRDRTTLDLPAGQDELIRRVAAVAPRTVVVVNAGAPVDLGWEDEVDAVLQCWFGGQEVGPALADVLTGAAEPGGRLPTTLPARLEHSPSHDNFPGENGELRYGEGLFMGYRGFEHRVIEPRYPFGHGLGYTSFAIDEPVVDGRTVRVPVTNTGGRPGSEVVQLYVAPRSPRLVRPPKELKAFRKVRLGPGESTVVELELDDRAFAYWDPGEADRDEVAGRLSMGIDGLGMGHAAPERRAPGWQVDPGVYDVLVGRSSAEITGATTITID
jgi:beta-glucosidase